MATTLIISLFYTNQALRQPTSTSIYLRIRTHITINISTLMFSIYPMFSFDTINKLFPTAQQWRWYGIAAISLKLYGSHTVWLLQAQIIGELQDEDAISFKKMAYDECTMIAVAVSRARLQVFRVLMKKKRLQLLPRLLLQDNRWIL